MKTAFVFAVAAGIVSGAFGQATQRGTFALRGKVVDAEGNPIEGATVERFQFGKPDSATPHELEPRQSATTGADGAFELRASRTTVFLLARKPGFAPAWRMLAAEPGLEHQFVLVPSTSTISGVVVDESGQPASNAQVWAIAVAVPEPEAESGSKLNLMFSRPARYCFMTNTGPDGRFTLTGFPTNATADFAANAPGKIYGRPEKLRDLTNTDALPYRASQQDVRIVLEPAGAVEGKVVVEGTTNPAPVTRVFLQADGPGYVGLIGREPALPAPDGTFRFFDVLPGTYTLRAALDTNAAPGWSAEPVLVTVPKGGTNRDAEIVVTPGVQVEVTVVRKTDGSPVTGAEVTAYSDTIQEAATSDTLGKVIFRLPAGQYRLSASKDKWASDEMRSAVEPGTTNQVVLELRPPIKLTGVVMYPDGSPAPMAEVRVLPVDGEPIRADSSGKFALELERQTFERAWIPPRVLARDTGRNLAGTAAIDEDTRSIEVRLSPGARITGSVQSDGQPVSNITATVTLWEGRLGATLVGLNVRSNEPGQLDVPALPTGYKYTLTLRAPGYGQKSISLDAPGINLIELGTLQLKPATLQLAGKVIDENGKPVARAFVNVFGEDQPSASTQADEEGRFKFDQVCEGAVRLYAVAQGLRGEAKAQGGDTNVVIELVREPASSAARTWKRLRGTVTDQDGKPAAGVHVGVFPNEIGATPKTDSQGTFGLTWSADPFFSGVPHVIAWDTNRNLAAAQELEEETSRVSLQLRPGAVVTGAVRTPDDKPVPNAKLAVLIELGNFVLSLPIQSLTDDQGRFVIRALPAGLEYSLRATAKGYGSATRGFIIAEEETNHVELEPIVLKLANLRLAGRVLDAAGKAVSGATVHLSGDDQPSESVSTNPDGRFEFNNVCEGLARIFAFREAAYAEVMAEGGDTNVVIVLRERGETRTEAPQRATITGKLLPDLTSVNIPGDAVPTGKPAVLCLFDPDQRPSRRSLRLLAEQYEPLKQKGVAVVAVVAAPTTPNAVESWKQANPLPFPVGYITEKSDKTKWVTEIESLPWLLLADAQGRILAEGFAPEELEEKLKALAK